MAIGGARDGCWPLRGSARQAEPEGGGFMKPVLTGFMRKTTIPLVPGMARVEQADTHGPRKPARS